MEECGYQFYSGHCTKPKPCPDHANEKCVSCKDPATRGCDYEGQFVCGSPLCGKCEYRMTDKVGFFGSYGHEHYRPGETESKTEEQIGVTIGDGKYVPEDIDQYAKGYKQGQIDMREIMTDYIDKVFGKKE
jgi:hypothetical protein